MSSRASEIEQVADDQRGVVVARAVPLGPPTEAQRELILPHVVDPTILEERELFVWSATVSNSNLDSYYTRMHESSLRNFVEDAKAGLSFMNSHRTGGWTGQAELPLGHSFDARYVGPSGAGPARVEESFYAIRGLNLTTLPTDQFIDGLRSGIARDISIGFIPGEYRCSIDGLNWNSYECRHWPGRTYPKLNAKGEDTGETELAYLWIHDAHQSEASSVFDGATPGCMVLKARRMAEAGEIRAETIDWLEQRYRIKLPHPARSFPGVDVPTSSTEVTMPPEPTTGGQQPPAFDLAAQLRTALTDAGVTVGDSDEALALAMRGSLDDLKRLRPLEEEVTRLRPLADEGRQYRADLVKDTLAEGARAYGAAFAEATYSALLESAPLETVKRMRDDWKAIGDKNFPGGRVTQDTAAETDPTPISSGRRRRVPASARG